MNETHAVMTCGEPEAGLVGRTWLQAHGLLDGHGAITWRLRP